VVGRYPVQPRPHRAAARIKPSSRPERGQERLGGHVVRGVAAKPSRGVSVYLAEVPVEYHPETLRVAQGQLDLLRVVVPDARGGCGHLSQSVMSPSLV
jgi:hypothetical protein